MTAALSLCILALATLSPVNDTCATADAAGTISNGAVAFVTRTLGPGNTTDHFRIGVLPGQRADIQALFDPIELDIDLRLWNADCSVLLDDSVTSGASEATEWLNDTGAFAEIVAEVFTASSPGTTVTYRLRRTGTQELCDFDDMFEPNETCATAPVAPSNSGFLYPLTIDPTDDDWVRFTVQPTSSAQWNVLGFQTGDLDIELWSADCATLLDSAAQGPVSIENTLATPMDVVLHVYRTDSIQECSTYSIQPFGSIGIQECSSVANTSGAPASIFGLGSASVSDDALFLDISTVPMDTVGLYIYGPNAASAPLGNGLLCVGAGLVRGPISQGLYESIQMRVRTGMPAGGQPPIAPGTTLRFQAWFRDAADPTGFGLSNALRVTFTP